MKRYKEVKVRCYKTGQNLYSEIFADIDKRELDEELDNFAKVGYDKLVITIDGKKQTLILAKDR
jgi:helix-turn-helix protein